MKKTINNLLYGQTSKLLAGRFDTDIYSQGCEKLENFNVLLQGGITRRPPKRILYNYNTESAGDSYFTKILNFTIDVTNSFLVLLGEGIIGIYDYNNGSFTHLSYLNDEGVDMSHGWSSLTTNQLSKVKSVVYYNDFLMVHEDVPLLRIKYNGGSTVSERFTIQIPELRLNETSKYWRSESINYGKDDFNPVKLNSEEGYYPSVINIISERLWLSGTKKFPYKIWASSVSESSQEIKNVEESDNLFDFIQFRVVETQNTEIDTSKLPVAWNGIDYIGSSYTQQMWNIPESADPNISTLDQFESYKTEYSLRVVMDGASSTYIKAIYNKELEYIYFDENHDAYLSATDEKLDITYDVTDVARIIKLSKDSTVYATAIPNYQTDLSSLNNMLNVTTELSLTATDSTSMEYQLASGRNDKVTWIGSGDYIMVGTESSLWRMPTNITALDFNADMYSSFGCNTGLFCNIGTDLVFLERGNKARLIYKDYYGLQNVNLSLTNPEILEGTILEVVSKQTDTPQVYFLKQEENNNSIVCVSIDRANGVQGWSKWTFNSGNIISLAIVENEDRQALACLVEENGVTYLAYFDEENSNGIYSDCCFIDNDLLDYKQQFTSEIVTNPFETETDNGTTFGDSKIVDKITFRAINTGRITTLTNNKISNTTAYEVAPDGIGDFSININGGTAKEISVTVQSYKDDPLTLLCMAYDVRLVNG